MQTEGGSQTILPGAAYWTQALESRLSTLTASGNVDIDTFYSETRAMKNLLAQICSRWKAFAPVNKLPAEILSMIFELLAFSGVKWQQVTCVSSFWRGVASNNPSLWTHLRATTEVHWNLSVERARARPLTVHIHGIPPRFGQLLPHLLRDFQYIENLHIQSGRRNQPTSFRELSTVLNRIHLYDAPLLQHLIVDLNQENYGTISLSRCFFEEGAVDLRSVELYGSHFPWGATSSTLTRLIVHKTPFVQSPKRLREGLQLLTSLEYLSLNITRFEEPEDDFEDEDVERIAIMRSLREVHLEGALTSCIDLVACLHLPSSAYLDVLVQDSDEDIELVELETFVSYLNKYQYGRLADSDYTTVKSSITSYEFELQVLTQPATGYQQVSGPLPGLRVRLPDTTGSLRAINPDLDDQFEELCEGLNKSQWRSAEFSGFWRFRWYHNNAMMSATGLEELSFKGVPRDAVESVLYDLQPNTPVIEKLIPGATVLFPALRSLTFERISFGCSASTCDGFDALGHTLRSALQERRGAGSPMSSLTIRECSIAKRYTAIYASEVEHYTWDGDIGDAHDCRSGSETSEDEDDEDEEDEEEAEEEIDSESAEESEDEDSMRVTRS